MVLEDIRTCPTFVINLDKRKDRWQKFSNQASLQEFSNLQRFSAVDGSKLDIFSDDRVSLHTRQNIMNKYRRSHYEINTPGAVGASLSHITLWQNFLKSDAEHLVVFEDDTIVDSLSLEYIDALIPMLPPSWDMWLLGHHNWSMTSVPITAHDKTGWHRVREFTGAHAYVLSRRGAQILCDTPFPIETHIEFYISACSNLKGLYIIKHDAFRMTYFAEVEQVEDSNTMNSTFSETCPVCVIPDFYQNEGFYLNYHNFSRMAVAVAALAFVGYGYYKSK
jgi:glycosyl transferase family 25